MNIEVLLGCTKASTIEYKSRKVLFEIDLRELELQKLNEIPVPSNPSDDNRKGMGNINMEEMEKMVRGFKCC